MQSQLWFQNPAEIESSISQSKNIKKVKKGSTENVTAQKQPDKKIRQENVEINNSH